MEGGKGKKVIEKKINVLFYALVILLLPSKLF